MNTFKLKLVMQAVDKMSKPFRKIGETLAELTRRAKLQRLEAGLKRVQQRLDDLARKAREVGQSFTSIGTDALTRITAPLALIGGFALRASGQMEKLQTAFESSLGSTEAAADMVNRLKLFAASTPFQLEGIGQTTKMLLAFGVQAQAMEARLKVLGDIAAGVDAPLNDIGLIFGQVKTKGKAMTEELLQLAERGVPIIDVLAKKMRVPKQAVFELASESQISFEVFREALNSMTQSGGIFANQMQKQSRTLFGLFSTLKDVVFNALANIGDQMNETFSIKEKLARFTDWVKETSEVVAAWMDQNPELAKLSFILLAVAAAAGPALILIGGMASGVSALATAFGVVSGGAAGLIGLLAKQEVKAKLAAISYSGLNARLSEGLGIQGALSTMKDRGGFLASLRYQALRASYSLQDMIGSVKSWVAAFGSGAVKYVASIKMMTVASGKWVAANLLTLGGLKRLALTMSGSVLTGLKAATAGMKALTMAMLANPLGLIIAGIAAAALAVYKNWAPISGFFKGLWRGIAKSFEPAMPAFEALSSAVTSTFETISSVVKPVLGLVGDLFTQVEDTGGAAEAAGERWGMAIGSALQSFTDTVAGVIAWFGSLNPGSLFEGWFDGFDIIGTVTGQLNKLALLDLTEIFTGWFAGFDPASIGSSWVSGLGVAILAAAAALDLSGFGSQLFAPIGNRLQEVSDQVMQFVSGLSGIDLGAVFTGWFDGLSAIDIGAIVTGWFTGFDPASIGSSWVSGLGVAILTAASALDLSGIGDRLAASIGQGFSNAWQRVLAYVQETINGLIGWMPSFVRDGLGLDTDEGGQMVMPAMPAMPSMFDRSEPTQPQQPGQAVVKVQFDNMPQNARVTEVKSRGEALDIETHTGFSMVSP